MSISCSDGAIVWAGSEDGWIGGFTYPESGKVAFNVEPNLSYEERTGMVVLDGIMNYYVSLTDLPYSDAGNAVPGSTYYVFDIYTSAVPENKEKIAVPEGTYVLGDASDGTFAEGNSRWFVFDATGEGYAENAIFTSGTLTVSKDGSGYRYEAELVDGYGNTHLVTYSGSVQLVDYSPVMSTLTSDYQADMEGAICDGEYYGDYFGTGTANWTIYIYQQGSLTGDYLKLELLTDPSFTPETGFPEGRLLPTEP